MSLRLGLVCLACITQSGCEMFSVISSPAQERGIKGFVSDNTIRACINKDFLCSGISGIEQVEFMIHRGRVLLMGVVSKSEVKAKVVEIVRNIRGVKEVIDEMHLGHEEFGDYANDAWIGHKLRSALFFDPNVFSQNYHVRVSDRIVYILGTAQSKRELDNVIRHAEELSVRRVVHYVTVVPPSASSVVDTKEEVPEPKEYN